MVKTSTLVALTLAGCSTKFIPDNLVPDHCFDGTPTTADEFLNACSTSECIPFDNCARFGLCGSGDMTVTPGTTTSGPVTTVPPADPTMPCSALGPNVIYVTGSSNFPPLLKAVAPLLLADAVPYHIVWQTTSSCAGADAIFSADTTKHYIKDIPAMGSTPANWAFFYNADGSTTTCNLDPAPGTQVTVGQSDVYASLCAVPTGSPPYAPDTTHGGYTGPIQTMTFVVPSSSSQRSISAEAAHFVFGNAGNSPTGMVAPWTDPNLYFVRSSSTGTNNMISKAIGIKPKEWYGIDRKTAANLSLIMQGVDPASAEAAIGVLSNDAADKARNNLRILAYQHTGQRCGFLPDSTSESADKANVRDGHYPIWGPVHLYTAISGGVPTPAANALITKLTVPKPDPKLLDAIIDAGFVPQCAMRVTRSEEIGDVSAYSPPYQCGCYFEYRTSNETFCKSCNGDGDCPTDRPACNNGFCELQ